MIKLSKREAGEDVELLVSNGCSSSRVRMTAENLLALSAVAAEMAADERAVPSADVGHVPTTGSRPQPEYHATRRNGYCHTCGTALSPLMRRRGGYQFDELPRIRDFRPVNPHPARNVYIEQSPGLMVYASIVRNGGPEDDICDECVKIGARAIRDAMNAILGE